MTNRDSPFGTPGPQPYWTPRKAEVLQLHSEGLTDAAMARKLGLSRVRIHQVRTKLGLTRNPHHYKNLCICGAPKARNTPRCPACVKTAYEERRATYTCSWCRAVFIRRKSQSRYAHCFCSRVCFHHWLRMQLRAGAC